MSDEDECSFPVNNSERIFILFDNISLLFIACCALSLLTTVVLFIFERSQLCKKPNGNSEVTETKSADSEHPWPEQDEDERPSKYYVSNVALAQKVEEALSEEQKQQENEAKREQLKAIFELLQSNSDKFGVQSMDELEAQMKLYSK